MLESFFSLFFHTVLVFSLCCALGNASRFSFYFTNSVLMPYSFIDTPFSSNVCLISKCWFFLTSSWLFLLLLLWSVFWSYVFKKLVHFIHVLLDAVFDNFKNWFFSVLKLLFLFFCHSHSDLHSCYWPSLLLGIIWI